MTKSCDDGCSHHRDEDCPNEILNDQTEELCTDQACCEQEVEENSPVVLTA